MKRWVLDIICCPLCRGTFIITETKGNVVNITEGHLTCQKCGQVYPITSGIADLLPPEEKI